MIYILGKEKLISLNEDNINDENYLLIKNILKDENVSINNWVEVSLLFHKKNYYKLFLDLIKEGEIHFNNNNNTNFNVLLLMYNLEKIINVKNANKEDELKIKVENLVNQIEKKKTEAKNFENIKDDYDYLSHFLIKGIYNVSIYLYLLNKYDNKSGSTNLSSSLNNSLNSMNLKGNINNEYINPLNYLIDSINIFIYLLKINNYDFVSSIYLSLSLCLMYKLDVCIDFSSYVLIRIIHFQNFLKSLSEKYKKTYLNIYDECNVNNFKEESKSDTHFMNHKKRDSNISSNNYTNTIKNNTINNKNDINNNDLNNNDINNNDVNNNNTNNNDINSNLNIENILKCTRIKNLLNVLNSFKSIIKYIIGICYMKKKNFSCASLCFTSSLKNYNYCSSYLTNSWLLLMNYLNKISENNDFIKNDQYNFLKYSNNSSRFYHFESFENYESDGKEQNIINYESYIKNLNDKKVKEYDFENKELKLNGGDVENKIKSYNTIMLNLNENKENILSNYNIKNNLKKIHIKEIINLTLFYYHSYIVKGIINYSKNLHTALNCEKAYYIDKNDIYEYDESIELVNNENMFIKSEYYNVFLDNNMISMYLDLCEIWLILGNNKSIILLKIIKEKINFNYVNKKFLSKYYFLIGMHYHIIKNMKKSLKYYHKSFLIYKNNISRYYYTICCIYLKKYNKAKKNLIYLYKKCKNAYIIKLYVFFFVHTSNIYLNYNLINKNKIMPNLNIERSDENNIITKNENYVQEKENTKDVYYIYNHKFLKSDKSNEMKIVFKMLQNMMNILNNNEKMFLNNLDIKLMKTKIYELLITKYNEDNIESYFKLLNEIHEVRNFFNNKSSFPKISYELINNYIISMFYCNFKEKSLELMELLKCEIFNKLKKFVKYYNYVICKSDIEKKEANLLYKKQNFSNNNNTKKKREGKESDCHFLKKDGNNNTSRKRTYDYNGIISKRRKNKDCPNINSNEYNNNNNNNNNNNKESKNILSNDSGTENKKKKKSDEIKIINKKKLKYIRNILRLHRICEIRNNLTNNKSLKEIYIKRAKKERYKHIINYLKKLYITVCFNNAMLLELIGYKDISINIYKLFTHMYVNYECAYIRLANIYIKDKNYSKAKEVIDNGLKKNCNSLNLFLLKSYLHFKRKHYDYSIYALEKLRKNDCCKNNILINTYLAIIKFFKLKECKSTLEKNYLINDIYNEIKILSKKKNNFFLANLISILLSVNHKYELSHESFQLILDSCDKLSFYYLSSLRNIVLHMFNNLIRNNHLINNKLFLNKLNVFFNLSLRNGINDKKFFLYYSNFLHILEKFDDAINLLYSCYVKWPHDLSILNSLIICIDSCVSKYLSYDYVELKNIFLMKDLINFSFIVIYTLLYFKHFSTTSELVGSDEHYNYYKEEDYIIEVKKKSIENLASRKYLVSTYKKFEEKIKPYIESSLPAMLKQKKMYHMKKINIQKKIYEEKKRKKMSLEIQKLKSQEILQEELLRDAKELTNQISEQNVKRLNQIEKVNQNIDLNNTNTSIKGIVNNKDEDKSPNEIDYNSSSNSSDLFEEKNPAKKRKKVID
ncbi:tetratricopeptide repeat family protein, putative [Plasmodium relictum]|uniref:Tetratricopeptide repeat family protein, putative n=1 Tax=Plasmodium relictum TaxID=85471 RepID=A0A1J1H763_PLARL|nr:tetratricopeptide repeat family protein, putative [Plasmodium relictum]CRG99427.1 tetratricopeptide repeat family protein, putative [Plasmodium relictum]